MAEVNQVEKFDAAAMISAYVVACMGGKSFQFEEIHPIREAKHVASTQTAMNKDNLVRIAQHCIASTSK
jgi:hypothetical protein